MKKLNQWLATAVFCVAMVASTCVIGQPSHIESFLTRAQSQQLNQHVLTLPVSGAPTAVQTFMGSPATTIQLDINALFTLSDFQIELPGLTRFYAVKESTFTNRLQGKSWIGDIVQFDPNTMKARVQGRGYFVENNGDVTGVIHTTNEVIQIYPDGTGGQVMISNDPDYFDNEGEIVPGNTPGAPQAGPSIGGRIDGESPASLNNPYVIDVMYVVTPEADTQTTDMPALIELALTTSNDVLTNSLIPARLRLVEIHYTSFQENGDMSDDLNALRNPTDGLMDEIHSRRSAVGADLVMLVSNSSNYCGIAYLDATPSWAFSVTYRGCMSSYTPIHEFGHNFGAHHDSANGTNHSYPFGYGLYNNIETPYWRTVMSYQCPGGGCDRIPYFTSPTLHYNNLPLGEPETLDNARVISVRAAEIASYFPNEVPYCTEHSATNSQHVSAGRAYTASSGGFFPTTTYYAVGSDDELGQYGFLSTTLAEDPVGYFSEGNCPAGGEPQFAPEVQNLGVAPITGGVRLSGEVFDANQDNIASVEAKISSNTNWSTGSIDGSQFEVEFPTQTYNTIEVDIRTTDATGESFSFTTIFQLDIGEPPVIELSNINAYDFTVEINGNSNGSDNAVTALHYQIDGDGNPDTGTWVTYAVTNTYWTLAIPNFPIGEHTVHVYGVDETSQRSSVESISVNVLAPQAPYCDLSAVVPATSGNNGEVQLLGVTEDANQSDVRIDYRMDNGTWTEISNFTRLGYRQIWSPNPGLTLADGATHIFEARAVDSTGIQTHCGSISHTVTYPNGDEAPSCELIDIFKFENSLRYYMVTSDPNGNQSQMFAKESSQSEWLQTWPNVYAGGAIPTPGIGEFTIQGRVVDTTGLEGTCESTIILEDQGYTPLISSAHGYFETELSTSVINIWVEDWDGDITSVTVREVGSTDWLSTEKVPNADNWRYTLGDIPNGQYFYEARATDSGGQISDVFMFNFEIERQTAPILSNVTAEVSGRSATVSGSVSDEENNVDDIVLRLDGRDWFTITAQAQWSFTFDDLSSGNHTIDVFARDNWGLESPTTTLSIEIDGGDAPILTNVNISTSETSATIVISATDTDNDIVSAAIQIDDGPLTFYPGNGNWTITVHDLAEGTHQLNVYVSDSMANTSATSAYSFQIVPSIACHTSTNNEHVNAGRATTRNVGETCFGTICFGGTTTYFALGSDDNMGTDANAETTLLETGDTHFEIGTCPVVDTTPPVITLFGASPMAVSVGETFVDPGASASDNIDGDISASIVVSGNVDTSTAGSYQLTYNVTDAAGNVAAPVIRNIDVVPDTVPPVISLLGSTEMSIMIGSQFTDPGATATDNVDGDISANITVSGTVDASTLGSYPLTYNVTDSSGNAATPLSRTVNVVADTTAPIITLLGDPEMTLSINDNFVDPGAEATDNIDGDLSAAIIVSGAVDTSIEGIYTLRYNVSDSSGNPAAEVTRTVNIIAGAACFEVTLTEHVSEGRAYEQYFSYYATGSATYLGSTFNDANTVVALEETSPGNWNNVGSCP